MTTPNPGSYAAHDGESGFMKPIAFDSANTTGYAYMANGTWVTGVLDMSGRKLKHRKQQWQNMIRIITDAIDSGCDTVVIEDCFIGKGINSFKSQVSTMTRLAVASEFMGILPVFMKPSVWQSASLRTKKHMKHDDLKAASKQLAKVLGAKNCTEDEADAVCMCDYAANNVEVKK